MAAPENASSSIEEDSPNRETETAEIVCPKCGNRLTVEDSGGEMHQNCHVCQAKLSFFVFPRLFRESPVETDFSSAVSVSGDATCHFYPELKAELVCDECGCFLSKTASVNWGGRDLCMPCLHQLRENKRSLDFQAETRVYDNRALALVTWMAPFTLFTAPLALFILIRHRKGDTGFVPRGKFRWWLAMVLSVLWIIFWMVGLVVWISLLIHELTN